MVVSPSRSLPGADVSMHYTDTDTGCGGTMLPMVAYAVPYMKPGVSLASHSTQKQTSNRT